MIEFDIRRLLWFLWLCFDLSEKVTAPQSRGGYIYKKILIE